jgi:acylphosphatase
VTNDDDSETEIIIRGDAEEVERFWKTLALREKGMEYVEGIL